MANYICAIRTNYFHVTDMEAYERLCDNLIGEDEICFFDAVDKKGAPLVGFGCSGYIGFRENEDDDESDIDTFYEKLSKLIPDGDACIVMEAGWEKLRYVTGFCTVVTNKGFDYVSMTDEAVEKARKLLEDPKWDTRVSY